MQDLKPFKMLSFCNQSPPLTKFQPSKLCGISDHFLWVRSTQDPTKLLRRCNEDALKLDPLRIRCASAANPHPSMKETTLRAAPFVDSFMDGCGEPCEAQGICNGSNFVGTSQQLRQILPVKDKNKHVRRMFAAWVKFLLILG